MSSKIWNRSQDDYSIVAIGFASASHYVTKGSLETFNDCFDLRCLEIWDSKSMTKQVISSKYVLLD